MDIYRCERALFTGFASAKGAVHSFPFTRRAPDPEKTVDGSPKL